MPTHPKRPQALLPPLEFPQLLEDGRVPIELVNKTLQVLIPLNDESRESDIVRLYSEGNTPLLDYALTASDAADAKFKVKFDITNSVLPRPSQGAYKAYTLDYEYVFASGESQRSGHRVDVIFDLEPPGGTALIQLEFTDKQRNEGITEADLEGDYLQVKTWPWSGMEKGDVITPWVSPAPPSGAGEDQYLIPELQIMVTEPGAIIWLKFAKTHFEGNGDRYFSYRLRDKLGNTSALSTPVKILVDV